MNISEFAKIAGVSKSAVSRYFNDGYLSEDKREKIEAAIEATGYAPSLAARSVRTRVTKMVGVILPKLSSESCARVTEGISEVLDVQGYKILLVNTANDYNKEIESLELFRQNRVDGVILLASIFTDLHKFVLHKMRVPVVIVGQHLEGYHCVCHNDEGAAYEVTRRMLSGGAKRPAMIAATMDDLAAGKARRVGFERAVEEAGLKLEHTMIEISKFDMDSGYEKAKKLLSHKDRPDAIFCATDNMAAGVMLYCREEGIRIPEDVMLCAIGDTRLAKIAYTPLTTVRLHHKTAGFEAADMLLSAIKNGSSVPRTLELDFDIVERVSTKKL